MKICCSCKKEKGHNEFGVRKSGILYSECKECSAIRSNKWYWENKDKSNERRKEKYKENREKTLERQKRYYKENRQEIRAKANIRNRTPEERKKSNARSKEWALRNKDKIRERTARWKRENKEKASAHQHVLWALRLNVLKKPEICCICQKKTKIEAHHEDYSKPLEVIWACKICHETMHHGEVNDVSSSRLYIRSD